MEHEAQPRQSPVKMFRDVRPSEPAGLEINANGEGGGNAASITFLIRAPEFDTAEITVALGLTPRRTYKPGQQVVTPLGHLVPGSFFTDTAWSYTWHVKSKIDFGSIWQEIMSRLENGSDGIQKVRRLEPTSLVLICRSSHVLRFGATIPSAELGRLAKLGVDFEFEVFAD
jgi:hypothetical protein